MFRLLRVWIPACAGMTCYCLIYVTHIVMPAKAGIQSTGSQSYIL
jgi:hypothetical protein